MTISASTLTLDHTSDAAFRVWGSQMNAVLAAAGLTNTSDTGQINWGSVTRAGTNADAGYEIWRWNDTAHSTTPLFLKFRYGTYTVTDRGRLRIDIGEGSNGSGTLTGAVKVDAVQWYQASNTTGFWQVGVCYNTTVGFFGIRLGPCSANNTNLCALMIDRLKLDTGAPSTRGFAVVMPADSPGNNASQYFTLTPGSISSDPSNTLPGFWPWKQEGAGSAGGTVVSGITPITGNQTHGPVEKTIGLLVAGYSDFAGGNVFEMDRWDGTRYTYVTTDCRGGSSTSAVSYYTRPCMLWE